MCDVVPMEASHILLGRLWQFDRNVYHDGHTNRYSFLFNNKKNYPYTSFSPSEVCKDQNIMRKKGRKRRSLYHMRVRKKKKIKRS